jgi:hypothetical protein
VQALKIYYYLSSCYFCYLCIYKRRGGGGGLAVNMSGQHVCVLRVRVRRVGILASDMAYGVVRQEFDSGL